MIYVGTSRNSNSLKAVQEALDQAMAKMIVGQSPVWALMFCGKKHDPDEVVRNIRAKAGAVSVVGGSAVGVISNTMLGYSEHELGLVLFSDDLRRPDIVSVDDISRGEWEAGHHLGQKLSAKVDHRSTVLVFYDSVRSGPPPVLNIANRFVEGIYAGLGDNNQAKLIGGGVLSDFSMSDKTYIFDGHKAVKHGAVAVVLPPELQSHTTIMHGCTPVSAFLEVTKVDGPVIYELDGRPVLDVLYENLGQVVDNLDLSDPSLIVTLGRKFGDPFAPFDEASYVNRLIVRSNPDDGSVTLFEADFEQGTQVQIMSRDNMLMVESVAEQTRKLQEQVDPQQPLFAFYVDCIGRASAFSGAEVEEASILQQSLAADVPLFGFYSGVEIAPLLGRSRPLDWTGVLTLFTKEPEPS